MNGETVTETITLSPPQAAELTPTNGRPPADAKQLRVEHVGKLLEGAYARASQLKLKKEEWKALTADFPDEAIETRFDGLLYLPHMVLRRRIWSVIEPGEVAEICRERMMRADTQEIAIDLVLLIRGCFAAEAIGTAKYYPSNPKGSFSDTIESAWSEALRRCCKRLNIGCQVWEPAFIREFQERQKTKAGKSGRKYTLKPKEEEPSPEIDEEPPF